MQIKIVFEQKHKRRTNPDCYEFGLIKKNCGKGERQDEEDGGWSSNGIRYGGNLETYC
jgi:hypothetical protein